MGWIKAATTPTAMDCVIVAGVFAWCFAAYCFSGGFHHDEWSYFLASDANLPARIRDLVEPLNEHFLPVTKLVQQIVYTIFGPNYLGIATVNFVAALASLLGLFLLVKRSTNSRIAAYVAAALGLVVFQRSFEALVWPGAGLSLFITAACYFAAAMPISTNRIGWRIALVAVMVFSSSAFPAFAAALVFSCGATWILDRKANRPALLLAISTVAIVISYFVLRSFSNALPLKMSAFDPHKLGYCILAPVTDLPAILKLAMLGLFPIGLALWFYLRGKVDAALKSILLLCISGGVIYVVGTIGAYVGRYSGLGCGLIEQRHVYVPLLGAAMSIAGTVALFASTIGPRIPRATSLRIMATGVIALLIAGLYVPGSITAAYGADYLESRRALGRSQASFFHDIDDMLCSVERGTVKFNNLAVTLPDLSMTACVDGCGLQAGGPFAMKEYGFSLATYAAFSHSACFSRRYISFAPIEGLDVKDRSKLPKNPKVVAFYRRYFGLSFEAD